MNHPMRRPERGISESEARQLLEQGEYGILSTCGADGQHDLAGGPSLSRGEERCALISRRGDRWVAPRA